MSRSAALGACLILVIAACTGGPSGLPATSPTPGSTTAASQAVSAPPSAPATSHGSPTPGTPRWARLETNAGPAPREDHTWTVDPATRTAWLFGGRDRGTVFGDLWSFDLATGRWTEVDAGGDNPARRFGHTGTWVDSVGLVVWSGQSGGDFFADLHAYDPATNRWTRLRDGGAPPEARYGSCATLGPDGRLWISHGFTHAGRFADTRSYDFAAGAWAEVAVEAERPVKRCLHDCLRTPDGQLVLYAGQTDGVPALGDLWTLDAAGKWTERPSPDPAPRQLYALAGTGDTARVFGGRGTDGKPLDDLWTLDLVTFAWQEDDAGAGPSARSGATLVDDPAGSRLLLFGGLGGSGALADVWELTGVR